MSITITGKPMIIGASKIFQIDAVMGITKCKSLREKIHIAKDLEEAQNTKKQFKSCLLLLNEEEEKKHCDAIIEVIDNSLLINDLSGNYICGFYMSDISDKDWYRNGDDDMDTRMSILFGDLNSHLVNVNVNILVCINPDQNIFPGCKMPIETWLDEYRYVYYDCTKFNDFVYYPIKVYDFNIFPYKNFDKHCDHDGKKMWISFEKIDKNDRCYKIIDLTGLNLEDQTNKLHRAVSELDDDFYCKMKEVLG